MSERERADLLLVKRGLFESRARAQAAIDAGLVTADGKPVGKSSELVSGDAVLQASPVHPWVSRGGVKLDAALNHYPIAVADHVCLDVGASTGGFTDVLLSRGARLIYAVDVGHDQLHPRLRDNPAIHSLEGTDIRNLTATDWATRPDVIVIDASFISLKLILPAALSLAARPVSLLALIKPQFEAGRQHAKKGIVRDTLVHDAVCRDIGEIVRSLGGEDVALFPSSITGGDGNIEFFIGARFG
jgi:23S rRNA (cytidine1920-2'-O)/16S rRNA (cytidine1409-2'-O)-methyltransferase